MQDSAINEIQEINLSYLLLAQRLLKEDFATARFRLKVDETLAAKIVSLTAKQLTRLARSNQFLFRLNLENPIQLEQLTSNKRAENLSHIHTALLMSSNVN
ncbi:flagellar transcriptional regulator FlhD [Microbulbifer elongatus]|uniref:Flagellar transcriptional regulator FlhD n=1 Tax=Microbulbifer elongatus TaxID=86173 RepID=A0ABT1NWS5_9GAMM|nr:flagellar transcriptional regulator FlhD [Microbulbifer elongatus]MCQ3828341.1 flagellar transcriptional regulator FlhD [Microbulbifer elongatus]